MFCNLSLLSFQQAVCLDPVHSVNQQLPPPAQVLDLVQRVALQQACLAAVQRAPLGDSFPNRTMLLEPINPPLSEVRTLFMSLSVQIAALDALEKNVLTQFGSSQYP